MSEEVLLTAIPSQCKHQPDMSQSHKQDIAIALSSDLSVEEVSSLVGSNFALPFIVCLHNAENLADK